MTSAFKLFLFCFIVLFAEKALFWLYLWQLKNYHLKRFLAHFTTSQGKKLIFNAQNIILLSALIWLTFTSFLEESNLFLSFYVFGIFILNILLALLSLKALIYFVFLRIKRPVLTKKTLILILAVFGSAFLIILPFLGFGEASISVFTVFLFLEPVFLSLIVMALEPLTVWQRKKILEKAKAKRSQLPDLKVVAITGSYGKTSTKEYLFTLLKEKMGDAVVETEKHINAEIGVAQAILNKVTDKTKVFIAEIGAYEIGKVKEVSKMIMPDIAVLTGINNQHLATFGSQENIVKAKFEIIDNLKKGGVAVLNIDSPLVKERAGKAITCSRKQEADIMAADVAAKKDELSFKVFTKTGSSSQFNIKAAGKANIENILLALACFEELGFALEEASGILEKKTIGEEAIKIISKTNFDLLLTDYSANLTGVIADLEHLKLWSGKRIVIMPCLIELGKGAKETHLKIGKKIKEVCDLAIITTKDYYKEVREGAKEKAVLEQDPERIKTMLDSLTKDSVVLVEGRVNKKIIEAIWK